jgi:hypothetical protein
MRLDGLATSLRRIEGLENRRQLRFDLPSSGNWQHCSDGDHACYLLPIP